MNTVARWVCINVPALPLQLVLRQHPEWARLPVAVIAEDRPQALILWTNTQARQAGISPGLRYAAGLALAPALRASVVSAGEVTESISLLTALLSRFTPEVEPSPTVPGFFWLNATGIRRLHGSLTTWAQAIHGTLQTQGFRATVVVGFSRVGTSVLAATGQGVMVMTDLVQEQAAVEHAPLQALGGDLAFRLTLKQLGISTIGEFVRLPFSGLLERFGPVAAHLHRWARGKLWQPLQPITTTEPIQHQFTFEVPETETTRLLFAIKGVLPVLFTALQVRYEALGALELQLLIEGGETLRDRIVPAAPTRDLSLLVNLVRLRLDALAIPAGVTAMTLTVQGTPATTDQLRLFSLLARRDLAAANRAVARVRAAFGNEAVVRVRLRDAHLPEACFGWEPLDYVVLPQPRPVVARPLVRRVFVKPLPLSPPPQDQRAQAWLIAGLEAGPVVRLREAGVISGGWWQGEIQRDYYFVETARGDVLWVYYDRRRRQWRCQGRVE